MQGCPLPSHACCFELCIVALRHRRHATTYGSVGLACQNQICVQISLNRVENSPCSGATYENTVTDPMRPPQHEIGEDVNPYNTSQESDRN